MMKSLNLLLHNKTLAVASLLFLALGESFAAQVELVPNGGFESGATPWYRNGDSGIFEGSYPHTPGTWYGYLGNVNDAIGSIHQFIQIPANASSATMTFYLNVVTYETGSGTTFDKMDVNFRHATSDALLKKWTTYSESDKGGNVAGQYSQKTISFTSSDLSPYKGQTVLLQFYATTDYGDFTIFRVDDISLVVTTDDTPAPPSTLETAGYADHIDLGWTDNSGNETGFKIDRKINNGSFSQLTTVGANTTLYTDNAVSECNVYTYRVRAYNAIDNSTYTDEVSNYLRKAPAAPNMLTANPTTNSISLAWQDNACSENGIKVDRRVGAAGTWSQLGDFAPNTVGVTDNSAFLGVTYYYRVYAYNALGNSAYSSVVSARRLETYTIGVSHGSNGDVTPNGSLTVTEGNNLDLSASPASNYVVDKWFLDGAMTQSGGNSYTLSAITADHTVLVTFTPRLYRLEIGGSVDDVQVFIDGNKVSTASIYNLLYGTQVTVRKYLQSPFQFVDYWSLVNQSGSQTFSGMAVTTPMFSDTVLQAILGTRNSTPQTGGTISGGTPVLTVPAPETTSPEVTRYVQRSHDLVCWHDYDLDPTTAQVTVNNGPCSFGTPGNDTTYFRTAFDIRVHAQPTLLFPLPGRSATSARVTSLLDHCNSDSLKAFPSDSSPNSSWYNNGIIGGYEKDEMFMTYKGEILCRGNSTPFKDNIGLTHFEILQPLARTLDLNYVGGNVISYSGHPGYDFGVSDLGSNVIVVASEKGVIIPSLSGSYENRIFIEHEELGLATAYLHMRKWSNQIFDHNDTAPGSKLFYYAKPVPVEKGEILGLAGGAGKHKDFDRVNLGRFDPHLHLELYRIKIVDGKKTYVLMDPYGAYTDTGKQAYGTSWMPLVTPPKTYNAGDYSP